MSDQEFDAMVVGEAICRQVEICFWLINPQGISLRTQLSPLGVCTAVYIEYPDGILQCKCPWSYVDARSQPPYFFRLHLERAVRAVEAKRDEQTRTCD